MSIRVRVCVRVRARVRVRVRVRVKVRVRVRVRVMVGVRIRVKVRAETVSLINARMLPDHRSQRLRCDVTAGSQQLYSSVYDARYCKPSIPLTYCLSPHL